MAAAKEFPLLVLGNPLLDIQAVGTEELLAKYGLKANDAILAEEKHAPLYDDLLTNYDAKLIAGGAAQNTARGAQYILPPNQVVYLGCVGDDKYASILRDATQAAGLRTEYRVDPTTPTGRCGVVITGHNRSLCTALDAANLYELAHLKRPEIWALAENAQFYYIGGYHFTVCPPAILELGKHAAENNKTFVLNLAAPFIPQFFTEPVVATLPYVDYLICNETEIESFGASQGLEGKSRAEIAQFAADFSKINGQRKRIVVVTQGTDATIVATQGETKIQEFPVHVIDAAKINDTNGAGDAFAGGFMAGLVQGKDLNTNIDMGQWLASLSIQELGPSFPTPKQTYSA